MVPLRARDVFALSDLAEAFNGAPEVDEFQDVFGLEAQGPNQLRNPSQDPRTCIGHEEDASGSRDSEAHEKGLDHLEETGARGERAVDDRQEVVGHATIFVDRINDELPWPTPARREPLSALLVVAFAKLSQSRTAKVKADHDPTPSEMTLNGNAARRRQLSQVLSDTTS
jgi:hypothetical protein